MEVIKNREALEKKHLLMRKLNNDMISQDEYDAEVSLLDKEIQKNVAEILQEAKERLHSEFAQIKNLVHDDGNMKRGVAKSLIKFLEPHFTPEEIKGIMRQGYKMERQKCNE